MDAKYNPVIFANLIASCVFATGNVVVLVLPLDVTVTVAVLAAVNTFGLLIAFLVTGKLAQSHTTPLDSDGAPLNDEYVRR